MTFKTRLNPFTKPADVYGAFRPSYLILKLFSLSPYEELDGRYSKSVLSVLYSIGILSTFLIYYSIGLSRNEILLNLRQINNVISVLDCYHIYAAVIEILILIVGTIRHRQHFIDFFEKLDSIDKELVNSGHSINYIGFRRYSTGILFLTILEVGVLEYYNCTMFLNDLGNFPDFCWLICYVFLSIHTCMEYKFLMLTRLIRQRFSAINSKLVERTPSPNLAEAIAVARRCHLELCAATEIFNLAISPQILALITKNVVDYTTQTYRVLMTLGKFLVYTKYFNVGSIGSDDVSSIWWAISRLCKLFVIVYFSEKTRKEAEKTIHILYKLPTKFDQQIAEEINAFSKQFLHWNVNITALDLFKIEMSLFFGIISASTTYLTIFLQLDIANPFLESASEPTSLKL